MAHVLVKAHVEHLVRLVQHDGLDSREVHRLVAVVVHQAAGRGDHDLAARLELALLLVHACAAVDADDAHAGQKLREVFKVARDLLRKLARGGEDHGPRLARRDIGDLFQNRDTEGHRLAGAGGGLGDHIVPGQHQRDGLLLDLGHLGIAHGLGRPDDLRPDGKFVKLHAGSAFRALVAVYDISFLL